MLYVLISFIVIDYITGVLAGIYNKQLSSYIGAKGIIKKVIILCMVWLAVCLDSFMGGASPWIRTVVIYFYIANEGLSILENIGKTGVPIPDAIKQVLAQLQKTEVLNK